MKNDSNQRISFRFLILGDSKIGKTSILERYVNRVFKTDYLVTIGMDIRVKKLTINNNNLDIKITDTAGQERFRSISRLHYKGADGILIGFALNDKKTFESISYWIEQIKENKGKNNDISLIFFGNKCDDIEHIEVNKDEINNLKTQYKLEYYDTSAKDDINIRNVFDNLIKETIRKKRLLKKFGFDENVSNDEIIINERGEENIIKQKKVHKHPKKKPCC